jgi:hypothetical protein
MHGPMNVKVHGISNVRISLVHQGSTIDQVFRKLSAEDLSERKRRNNWRLNPSASLNNDLHDF